MPINKNMSLWFGYKNQGCQLQMFKAPQNGSSLLIVLILLAVVSILGIGTAQISLLAERSARNDRDLQIAFQSAESALYDATNDIAGTGTGTRNVFSTGNIVSFVDGCGTTGNSQGLCLPAISGKPAWLTLDLATQDTKSAAFGQFTGASFDYGAGAKPAKKPRYIIEAVADTVTLGADQSLPQTKMLYRVTAIGFGPRTDIQSVVQIVYRKE